MDIEGVVYEILAPVEGVSAKGNWIRQEVVFENPSDFNRKVCIQFWGDRVQEVAKLIKGDAVQVSFNIDSREHNGRWFTTLSAWRIQKGGAGASAAAAATPSFGAVPTPPPAVVSAPLDSYSNDETADKPF